MKIFRHLAIALLLGFLSSGANALQVNITMTVDNMLMGGGLCFDSSCMTGIDFGTMPPFSGSLPNINNWTQADTVSIDLAPGTYWFGFRGVNLPNPGSGNPAALLAEITWAGGSNSSSSAWERSLDNRVSWDASTEWAQNGGGIWNDVLGGPVSGISTNAYWIWDDINFSSDQPQDVWFRTNITIGALPEPGMLLLMMIGLVGLASVRRRA